LSRRFGLLATLTLVCAGLCRTAQAQDDAPVPADASENRSIFSKAADWIESKPLSLRQKLAAGGVFPSLAGFAQNTGVSPGLTMVQPGIGGSGVGLMFSTARSFRGDEFDELRVGRLPYATSRPPSRQQTLEALTPAFAAGAPQRFFAYGELRRRNLEGGELFDDQGGSTPYQLDDTTLDLVVGWHPTPHWIAAVRAGTLSAQAQLQVDENDRLASLRRTDGRDHYFRTSAAVPSTTGTTAQSAPG
jgi:hypothetical protein